MRIRLLILSILALFSTAAVTFAQNKLLTIDDIYDPVKRVNFSGTTPSIIGWLNNGNSYLLYKQDAETRLGQLMRVNAQTGETSPFYDAIKMERSFATLPGITPDNARQLARLSTYQFNPAQTAVLINYANDLFYYDLAGEKATRLTASPGAEVGEEFSPDGRMVSYVRDNNIYIVDIATQRERGLTADGSGKVYNGRLNWVYQEEIYGRGNFKGYWWSPDSSRITFLRLDDNPVHEFMVVDHIPMLQGIEDTPYPLAGNPNPGVRLGVVNVAGGAVRWVDTFKYQSGDHLIVRVNWSPDSRRIVYQVQDREQTWLDLNYADPVKGETNTLFRETTKAWVEAIDSPLWLKDGSFLWRSERNGWQHVYHYAADGKLIRQVTNGKWEVRDLHGADEAKGLVYFSGTEHSHIAVHPYRIKLDGTGLTRLSKAEGNHSVKFNPTFTMFIDNWSDINTPTQVRLFTADGNLARVIEENKVAALSQYRLGKVELLQVKARDGFTLEAMMIRPPDFDPNKKYPVMSYTYSGPQSPRVRNLWGGNTFLWHQMLAQKGYIIWVLDNRTASGKGAESAWPLYQNFGELELRDLEDGISWLKSQPYVDGTRVGLWGWSFGGFMTLYALTHSQSFKLGIAGGNVVDWRLYDSVYTERYMRTPQNNPEGYEKSAPLSSAKNLNAKLLLLHGMIDDNVHMQNTIKFAYELQQSGKPFQLMLYPKSRHGLTDPLLQKHMQSTMTDFILANL